MWGDCERLGLGKHKNLEGGGWEQRGGERKKYSVIHFSCLSTCRQRLVALLPRQ